MTSAASQLFAETDRAVARQMQEGGTDDATKRLVETVDPSRVVRFWARVDQDGAAGCWEWSGARNRCGYGVGQKILGTVAVHRIAWMLCRGPIPEGFHVDHLCRNRSCVNPDHLEPVHPVENTRRSRAWLEAGRKNAARTHCPKGHPYDEKNTFWLSNPRRRDCRTCVLAGAGKRATRRSKTHCPQGHEYTPENTFMDLGKWRRCLACRRHRDRLRARLGDTHGLTTPQTSAPAGANPRSPAGAEPQP